MLSGIVAEKSNVWRFSGIYLTMRSIWTLKPISSIRSISSNTRNSAWSRSRFPRSRWSLIRPGVPTTRRGRWRNCWHCLCMPSPPIRNAVFILLFGPSIWCMTSITCLPSSLVGVMTSAVPRSEFKSCSSNGIENAAVFPVPVCAEPRTSLPCSAIGIACA